MSQCAPGVFNLNQKFHGLSCFWGLYIRCISWLTLNCYIYKNPKSKKVHGPFSPGWEDQEHTVMCCIVTREIINQFKFAVSTDNLSCMWFFLSPDTSLYLELSRNIQVCRMDYVVCGPHDYLDISLLVISGKCVSIRNFKKW